MIKFFRKIRQRLLAENKISRYLVYAVGEIILVVIGILIAIQLNSVEIKNEKRVEEIVHLENLLSDLKQDKIELEKIIERRKSKSNSAKIMVNLYQEKEVSNINDYYSHLMNVIFWDAHNPSLLTFNELINSGKLSSLSNAQIKNLLLQIDYKYNELFEVRKHLYEDHWEYFYRPFADFIDYENAIKAWTEQQDDIELSKEFIEIALQSKRIKNGFTLSNFNNTILADQLIDILAIVNSSIVLIEQEIQQ